jgi:hypothetical protein
MKPAEYSYGYHVAGNTLDAVRFQVTINDATPSSTLATLSAAFYKDGVRTLTITSTIINATTWIFDLGPVAAGSMNLEVGTHELQVTTTNAAGRVRSYVAGTIKILEKAPA